jgi:hypothetical protein
VKRKSNEHLDEKEIARVFLKMNEEEGKGGTGRETSNI